MEAQVLVNTSRVFEGPVSYSEVEQEQDDWVPLDLADLWWSLTRGEVALVSEVCTEKECSVLIKRRTGSKVAPQSDTAMQMLSRILTGESQKCVAFEAAVSLSTVAMRCSQCLSQMGRPSRASQAPFLLMLAAHAARGLPLPPARARRLPGAVESWLVSCERPDRNLAKLSEAEREVTRLFLEGRTHAQIAGRRGSSTRTIANQLGAVFRKLGASRRAGVAAKLIVAWAAGPASPAYANLE